jgi:hypothetical protein
MNIDVFIDGWMDVDVDVDVDVDDDDDIMVI